MWKIVGYLPPKGFAAEMEKAQAAFVNRPKWEEALKKDPNNLAALLGLIPIYVQEGNGKEAEAMLRRAEAQDPTNAEGKLDDAYNAIGDAYQMQDDHAKAVPFFEKAAQSKDEDKAAYALISIAYCLFAEGKAKESIPHLERLIKMGPAADDYREQAKGMLAQAKR
ncbi:MAG TPA: tetratricopeptide repeat protein [Fimbriimonas sp.]